MIPRTHILAKKYPQVEALMNEVKSLRRRLVTAAGNHRRDVKQLRKEIEGMQMKWEYLVVTMQCNPGRYNELLNDYGDEGWQLIYVDTYGGWPRGWFKRPRYNKPGPKPKDQEVSHSGTTEGSPSALGNHHD